MPPVTIIQMPTVPLSLTVWKTESKGPPALFCNSFGEESNNLELPGKITDKTLMKNLIPTSTVSSGVLLYYCHFLALLPPLSFPWHFVTPSASYTWLSSSQISWYSRKDPCLPFLWKKTLQRSLAVTVVLNKMFSIPEGKWYGRYGKSYT